MKGGMRRGDTAQGMARRIAASNAMLATPPTRAGDAAAVSRTPPPLPRLATPPTRAGGAAAVIRKPPPLPQGKASSRGNAPRRGISAPEPETAALQRSKNAALVEEAEQLQEEAEEAAAQDRLMNIIENSPTAPMSDEARRVAAGGDPLLRVKAEALLAQAQAKRAAAASSAEEEAAAGGGALAAPAAAKKARRKKGEKLTGAKARVSAEMASQETDDGMFHVLYDSKHWGKGKVGLDFENGGTIVSKIRPDTWAASVQAVQNGMNPDFNLVGMKLVLIKFGGRGYKTSSLNDIKQLVAQGNGMEFEFSFVRDPPRAGSMAAAAPAVAEAAPPALRSSEDQRRTFFGPMSEPMSEPISDPPHMSDQQIRTEATRIRKKEKIDRNPEYNNIPDKAVILCDYLLETPLLYREPNERGYFVKEAMPVVERKITELNMDSTEIEAAAKKIYFDNVDLTNPAPTRFPGLPRASTKIGSEIVRIYMIVAEQGPVQPGDKLPPSFLNIEQIPNKVEKLLKEWGRSNSLHLLSTICDKWAIQSRVLNNLQLALLCSLPKTKALIAEVLGPERDRGVGVQDAGRGYGSRKTYAWGLEHGRSRMDTMALPLREPQPEPLERLSQQSATAGGQNAAEVSLVASNTTPSLNVVPKSRSRRLSTEVDATPQQVFGFGRSSEEIELARLDLAAEAASADAGGEAASRQIDEAEAKAAAARLAAAGGGGGGGAAAAAAGGGGYVPWDVQVDVEAQKSLESAGVDPMAELLAAGL